MAWFIINGKKIQVYLPLFLLFMSVFFEKLFMFMFAHFLFTPFYDIAHLITSFSLICYWLLVICYSNN